MREEEKKTADTLCVEIPFYDETLVFTEMLPCKDMRAYCLLKRRDNVYFGLCRNVSKSIYNNRDKSLIELTEITEEFIQFVAFDLLSGEYDLKDFSMQEKKSMQMYFNFVETYETTGTPVGRLDDVDESYDIFKDCMMDAVGNTEDFYYNFSIDKFICYEVNGSTVKVTTYTGSSGTKTVSTGRVGSLRSPTRELVTKTSAYGKVRFDIRSILDGNFITKTKDIYCALEINE